MTDSSKERCPRCAGRLATTSDYYSRYLTCLMCGYAREPKIIDQVVARLEAEFDFALETTR